MPTFTSQRPAGIAESFASLMQGNKGLSQTDILNAEKTISGVEHSRASAQHQNALAEKVRLELEQMREQANMRKDPNMAAEFAARSSGINVPDAQAVERNFRGEQVEIPGPPNIDAGETSMPSMTSPLPAGMAPSQLGLYQAARAGLMATNLATGKTNGEQLTKSVGEGQQNSIMGAVQTAIANNDMQRASAMNQGAKPGNAIKLFDNIGNTGATVAPATGAVNADPNSNPLMKATLAEVESKTGAHKASAANSYASAAQHGAQTAKINGAGAGSGGAAAAGGGAGGLSGGEFLATLPPGIAATVKGVTEGKIGITNFSTKGGERERILELAGQYEPGFDLTNWKRRNDTATAFSKGKQGDAVRAVNQTISHAGSLSDAIDELNNMGGMGTMLNSVVNAAQEHTGDSRQGVFRQRAQAVASELRKVFSGSGGGSLTELEKWESSLPQNASKDQQKAYLKSGIELLGGAINALDDQYKRGMGPNSNVMDIMSPKAKAAFEKLSVGGSSKAAPKAQAATKVINGVTYVNETGKADGWHTSN